jgi:hypothetical protein
MKAKRNWYKLTLAIVGALLLLGVSSAQAATVIFENGTSNATGILNLDIGGTLYNVAFTPPSTAASQVYGPYPGEFDFDTNETARNAADEVNSELTLASALTVGAEGSGGLPFYRIGWISGLLGEEIELVGFWEAVKDNGDLDPWLTNVDPDGDSYNLGVRIWVDFTPVPIPAAVWLLGGGLIGLFGLKRRLKN